MFLLKVPIQASFDQVGGLLLSISRMWVLNLLCNDCAVILGFSSIACYYIDNIPCFAANGVFDFQIVVFGGAPNVWFGIEGFTCQAVIVTFFD